MDCYSLGESGEVYMMLVGQKATAKENEKETAEKIANSWRVEA